MAHAEVVKQYMRGATRTQAIRAMLTRIFDVGPMDVTDDAIRRAVDTLDLENPFDNLE